MIMNQTVKRILAMLLCAVTLVGMFPAAPVSASEIPEVTEVVTEVTEATEIPETSEAAAEVTEAVEIPEVTEVAEVAASSTGLQAGDTFYFWISEEYRTFYDGTGAAAPYTANFGSAASAAEMTLVDGRTDIYSVVIPEGATMIDVISSDYIGLCNEILSEAAGNMYCCVKHGDQGNYYWTTYDANAVYEDKKPEVPMTDEYVYFDNSIFQWDPLFVSFIDAEYNQIGGDFFEMTTGDNGIASAQVPVGTVNVSFGNQQVGYLESFSYTAGKTYSLGTYGYDRVYLWVSDEYNAHYGYSNIEYKVGYMAADSYTYDVVMQPLEENPAILYADIPENSIRNYMYIWYGDEYSHNTIAHVQETGNMYCATVNVTYGSWGWTVYDPNTVYEDKLPLSGEFAYFDNTLTQWDAVYALCRSEYGNDIGVPQLMTNTDGNLWSIEVPVGTRSIGFCSRENWPSAYNDFTAGSTYSYHYYEFDKIYLFMSEEYILQNYSQVSRFYVNYLSSEGTTQEVDMQPVEGNPNVLYADIPENTLLETLNIHWITPNSHYGCGAPNTDTNMYCETVHTNYSHWIVYDSNTVYEDKLPELEYTNDVVYFDNSDMQWDTLYINYRDNNWNSMGYYPMTKSENSIWSAQIPVGCQYIGFSPVDSWSYRSEGITPGKVYTIKRYAFDKLYLFISDEYIEKNNPGMDNFCVSYTTVDVERKRVEMKPVDGNPNVLYADIPADAVQDWIHIYPQTKGQGQYGWGVGFPNDNTNMFVATLYCGEGWEIYDPNTVYEDKLNLSGEFACYDNTDTQWDAIYASFWDHNWNELCTLPLTKGNGNIWSVEVPVGTYFVSFGPSEHNMLGTHNFYAGQTYGYKYYAYDKVYLFISDAYIAEEFPGARDFVVRYTDSNGEPVRISMEPLEDNPAILYADIPAKTIRETIWMNWESDNGRYGSGSPQDNNNMFMSTLYCGEGWEIYDPNTKYEDKLNLSGEFIYFDNSAVKWDSVYARFMDSDGNGLGTLPMTKGDNNIWSVEVPVGADWVNIGPDKYRCPIGSEYVAGKTYSAKYYESDTVYLWVSDVWLQNNYPDVNSFSFYFYGTYSGYNNVQMQPVEGKANIWYANVPENTIVESMSFNFNNGMNGFWVPEHESGCDMFCVTFYSSNHWTTFDEDTDYVDEIATSGKCGKTATWKFDKKTGTLTISGTGKMNDYQNDWPEWGNLTDSIKTIKVEKGITSIGSYAFYGLSNVTKVSLGSTVKTIGEAAFGNCESLTSIKIPAALKTLGEYAFYNAPIDTITISSSNKYFVIEDGVLFNKAKTILHLAETGHKTYTVPSTVVEIRPFSFNDPSLTKLTIPEGVEKIGDSAFFGTKLTSIKLPASLTELGVTVFGSMELKKYSVASGSKTFSTKDGVLFNKDKTVLIAFPSAVSGSYTVPSTVKELGMYAFWNAMKVTSITLPDGITAIPNCAFGYCKALKSINIPEGVTSIGGNAFIACDSLKSIYIPGSVREFGFWVFTGSGLEEVVFGYGITNLGQGTFAGSHKLEKVHIPDTFTEFGDTNPNSDYFPFIRCGDKTDAGKVTIVGHSGSLAAAYASQTGLLFESAEHKNHNNKCVYCNTAMKLKAPVIDLEGVSSSGKNKITWKKVDGAEEYQVYRATSKDGKYTKLTTTSKTSYTDKSAEAGKKYYYKVRAVTENGTKSSYSNIEYRYCDLPRPEVEESNVTSSGKIKLEWEKIEGAKEYEIYRATSKSGTYKKLATTEKTSYTDKTAKAGKVYYYKVKAIHKKSSANSAYSSVVSQTCKLERPDVSIKLSSGNPKLTWDEVDGAKEYKVYRATSKNGTYKLVKTTTSEKFTDKSVTAGKTYYYKVKAIHSKSSANSAYSSVDSIKAK